MKERFVVKNLEADNVNLGNYIKKMVIAALAAAIQTTFLLLFFEKFEMHFGKGIEGWYVFLTICCDILLQRILLSGKNIWKRLTVILYPACLMLSSSMCAHLLWENLVVNTSVMAMICITSGFYFLLIHACNSEKRWIEITAVILEILFVGWAFFVL